MKLREWTLLAILPWLWACGGPEQSTIDQFFRAAQSNDPTTLAYMSAVGPPFEVDSWSVVEVSSRTTEPFTLPELAEKFQVAEKEREAALAEAKKYFEDNQQALETIIPRMREDAEYKFRGRLGEIQAEWMRLTEQRREKEGAFQELKSAVDRESRLASKSVMRQTKVAELDGDIAVTEMLLNLKQKDGAEHPFKFTLRKYNLAEAGSDRVEPARWIIYHIEGTTEEARAAASAASRSSAPASASSTATAGAAETSEPPAETSARESTYLPRELRGTARVQVITPKTQVAGDEVVTTVRVQNTSKDWITRFTVTEHWYDEQGNVLRSSSRTHQGRFMPGESIELELRTRKDTKFYQNQFEFTHANGDVRATTVESFTKPT